MKFDFIGKKKIWYIVSIMFILISLISLFVQGLNFGIDFQGGSLIHLKFTEDVRIDEIRAVLAEHNLGNSSIQESTDETFTIKSDELEQTQLMEVLKSIEEKLGTYELLRTEKVGPVIGSELRRAGILALMIAGILMVIYITIRFEFKFGIAAIIALLHDVIIVVGFFSVFQIEVGSTFIAAILTIIGYSINDTIVVFDRIRENMKNRRKEDLAFIINSSINQTIARSLNTSLTTMFVVIALLLLGGETTKNFSLAFLVGIISGTYSSIFVASPLWYEFKPEEHKKVKVA